MFQHLIYLHSQCFQQLHKCTTYSALRTVHTTGTPVYFWCFFVVDNPSTPISDCPRHSEPIPLHSNYLLSKYPIKHKIKSTFHRYLLSFSFYYQLVHSSRCQHKATRPEAITAFSQLKLICTHTHHITQAQLNEQWPITKQSPPGRAIFIFIITHTIKAHSVNYITRVRVFFNMSRNFVLLVHVHVQCV